MPDLRKDALLALAGEMSVLEDMGEENVGRKLVLAALFQETLHGSQPHCYSPELVIFLRTILEQARTASASWLSLKYDQQHITKSVDLPAFDRIH